MSEGRLHPAAIAIVLVREMRTFAFTFIPSLFDLYRGTLALDSFLFPIIFGSFSLARAVLGFFRFRYRLSDESLVIDSGWISHTRKVIPRARIQSVDTVRRLTHRAFGVVELRVEVVGGQGQAEGTFPALRAADADRLRAVLLGGAVQAEGEPEPAPEVLVKLTPGDIVLAGVTGGRIATLGLLVGAIMQQLSELVPEDEDGLAELVSSGAQDLGVPLAIAALGLVVAILFVSVIFSLIATLFVYWDFTLRRSGSDLIVERGLLDQRRSVIPLRRIQAVRVHENLVRRPMGLASLTVVVAGYAGSGSEAVTSSMLLPVGRRAQAHAVAEAVLSLGVAVGTIPLEPAPSRAMSRRIVQSGLVLGLFAVPAAWMLTDDPLWGLTALILALPLGYAAWRALGHAIQGRFAYARRGVLDRVLTISPIPNLQLVHLRATPLQRARRLATMVLKVPKGSSSFIDLDRARAEERFAELRAAMQPT